MKNQNMWSTSALNGLLLSLITIIYSLLSSTLEPKGIVAILLWIMKTAGCIALLYYFMKQFSINNGGSSYKESFMYGFWISMFSSIICAAFNFININFIYPEQIDMIKEGVLNAISSRQLSSEDENMITKILDNLPSFILFFSLFYYMICGIIIPSIIANFTKSSNPFDNNTVA